MQKLLILLLGLLLFLMLGYWCVYIKAAPAIQKDITDRATQALKNAGYNFVKLEVRGRDITVRGTTNDPGIRGHVDKTVQVEGVRQVIDEIIINDSAEGYQLTIINDGSKITVKGFTPDTNTHHNLISYLMEEFEDKVILDQLTEQPGEPDNWIVITKAGLEALKKLQKGKLEINKNHLVLSGVAPDLDVRDQIITTLSTQLEGGISVTNDITVSKENSDDNESEAALPDVASDEPATQPAEPPEQSADKVTRQCQQKITGLLKKHPIKFESGSVQMLPQSQKTLKDIGEILQECTKYKLQINGYTDSQGSAVFNQKLSKKRAEAVKAILIKIGVDGERILAQGFGESNPVADNVLAEGRKQNRRIEIIILKEPKE